MRRTTALASILLLAGVCTAWPAKDSNAASANVARQFGNAIADAVEKVTESVVVVRTADHRYFVDIFRGRRFRRDIPGQGSGMIISEDGYVLTSNHVIANAEELAVELHDGTLYPAKIVGRDPFTDMAVLKIEPLEGAAVFKPIEFGDSNELRVGEFVIAIGAPFSVFQDLEGSVTLGIVSQKGRTIGLLPYEDFIQTDAPINPGNSGGPLVDVDGRMIGVNTLIQKGGRYSEGNIGIGFAVPVNLAKRVSDSLIRTGKVEHPWLGITMLQTMEGVTIQQVVNDTPAEKSGLQEGDLILQVEGIPIKELLGVKRGIFQNDVGDTVELTIEREGRNRVVPVTLEAMPKMLNIQQR